jgi:hypothetical protein
MQITNARIDLRKILCWIFASTALMYLLVPNLSVLFAIRPNASQSGSLFVTFAAIVPILCGIAWWTIWKEKPSARAWGIAASLVEIVSSPSQSCFLRQLRGLTTLAHCLSASLDW